jgi:single-strand DNA-binding protein
MPYLSSITILGHAGGDAECRQVGDTTCTTVSVAVNTRYKDKDGDWKDRTTWWRVSVWGKPGEWLARDCRKGSLIMASGEAEVREWTDKEGSKRFSAEIRATACRICDGKQHDQHGAEAAAAKPRVPAAPARPDDSEPPF